MVQEFAVKEIVLFIHIALATFWVGGMIFLVLVVSPFVRKLPIKDEIYQAVGKRFSFYGTFITLSLLFVTGLWNFHNVAGLSNLFDLSSPYTVTFWHKLVFFFLVVLISLFHDLYFGVKAVNSSFHAKVARLLGLVNLLLSLYMVFLASKLRFGG